MGPSPVKAGGALGETWGLGIVRVVPGLAGDPGFGDGRDLGGASGMKKGALGGLFGREVARMGC